MADLPAEPHIYIDLNFTLSTLGKAVAAQEPNANLVYGTLDGNVRVLARGFKLTNYTITGYGKYKAYTVSETNGAIESTQSMKREFLMKNLKGYTTLVL